MKVSREQMRANRERILLHAGRLFRERGFDAVGVAEVMQAAGLTHGGFYGHFASKDDLVAHSLAAMFAPIAAAGTGAQPAALDGGLARFVDGYLSSAHRGAPETGCPTAALSVDAGRHGDAARQALTDGVAAQIDRIAATLSPSPTASDRTAAIGLWATLVGAVVLARATERPLSDEILAGTKAWIERTRAARA